ncbi:MAG TPA: hypothetical protein VGF63_10485 [Solirubrobacteraceae bacterium]
MKRLAALLCVFVLGLAIPALATAQLGPTNVPAPLTAPDPSQLPAAPVNDDDGGLSSTQILLMIGGAIVVVSVIAWVIVRDARSVAPVRGSSSSGGGGSGSAAQRKSAREREREQARKRAKAKHVRDQRKRNRPR